MKLIPLFLLFVFGLCSSAQVPVTADSYRTNVTAIPKYNALTGQKMSDKEFVEMARKNPGLVPRNEIDKYGRVKALYFDPNKTGRVSYRDTSLRVKSGNEFLSFVMRTTEGKKLDSKKLKGKKIVLHWQLFMRTPGFSEKDFRNISAWVKEKQKSEEVVLILLTHNSKDEIDPLILDENEIAQVVPSARNFSERYIINSYPSNILIDEKGKLVGYYDNLEFERLKADW